MLLVRCLSCPVCDIGVLWPNGWIDQDATWYGGRSRPPSVRWGPSYPKWEGTTSSFWPGPCLLWPNGWIKMPLDMEIGLGPGDIVADADPSPPKRNTVVKLKVVFGCGCMVLGTKTVHVDFSPTSPLSSSSSSSSSCAPYGGSAEPYST